MKDYYWQRLYYKIIKICYENENNLNLEKYDCYRCITPPRISVLDYMAYLETWWQPSDSTTFGVAEALLERFLKVQKLYLKFNNVHRILLVTLLIATKWNDDFLKPLQYYAKIGGVDKKELSSLERKFLKHLNYNIFVNNLS
tara:strand:- start:372 stop:797 length:426 start_codon:yes stop_codon:yes gene_type:complete